jgi:hypothetical protein
MQQKHTIFKIKKRLKIAEQRVQKKELFLQGPSLNGRKAALGASRRFQLRARVRAKVARPAERANDRGPPVRGKFRLITAS